MRDAEAFRGLFGAAADAAADAPGRVNLIGEHTDYHEGFVLPTPIPQRAHVAGRRRADGRVRVWSRGISNGIVEFAAGAEQAGRDWLDYVQGVTALVGRELAPVRGLDILIGSDVPPGAGVSSSAALTVALLRLLRRLYTLDLDDLALARLAQRVETEFVGAPVGIMDQMACSLGAAGEALFVDTRTLAYERVRLPAAAGLVVIDSGQTHRHAGGGYVTRRQESFEAAARLGVRVLRDADLERVTAAAARLDPLLVRRARHVVTENRRVAVMADALARGDLASAGRAMNASHASMRDDYEISTAEIDTLVAVGQRHPDVYGARLTGGGFGGAAVLLVRAGTGGVVSRDVTAGYRAATGLQATAIVPPAELAAR